MEKRRKFRSDLRENVSTLAALLTIIICVGVFSGWVINRNKEFDIFLCDQTGLPRTDLAVETPDGIRYTYNHGKIVGKTSWIGQEISIHEARTWRWIDDRRLIKRDAERMVKMIVKNHTGSEEAQNDNRRENDLEIDEQRKKIVEKKKGDSKNDSTR